VSTKIFTNSKQLFDDQFIDINLIVDKSINTNKKIYIKYSMLIEKNNISFTKVYGKKSTTLKPSNYQLKKILLLISKLRPIITINKDSYVEYDLQIKSKSGGFENITLRNRWTNRPQVMKDMFEKTFWYKEPHQKLADYIESFK